MIKKRPRVLCKPISRTTKCRNGSPLSWTGPVVLHTIIASTIHGWYQGSRARWRRILGRLDVAETREFTTPESNNQVCRGKVAAPSMSVHIYALS